MQKITVSHQKASRGHSAIEGSQDICYSHSILHSLSSGGCLPGDLSSVSVSWPAVSMSAWGPRKLKADVLYYPTHMKGGQLMLLSDMQQTSNIRLKLEDTAIIRIKQL